MALALALSLSGSWIILDLLARLFPPRKRIHRFRIKSCGGWHGCCQRAEAEYVQGHFISSRFSKHAATRTGKPSRWYMLVDSTIRVMRGDVGIVSAAKGHCRQDGRLRRRCSQAGCNSEFNYGHSNDAFSVAL